MAWTVLFRCSQCNHHLIRDDGPTFELSLGHWRINKTSGKVTALCSHCSREHVIQAAMSTSNEQPETTTALKKMSAVMSCLTVRVTDR